jgi:K+-transporting ATPase c subunit
MEKMINQMVEIIKNGTMMGGAHSDQDKDGAVLYYHSRGEFYIGNAENGGPAATDECITEAELKKRLEAHCQSLSAEELEEDRKVVQTMYDTITEVTEEEEDEFSRWFKE